MDVIHTMPKLLGQQFYPNGLPLKADSIFHGDHSIEQIFIDNVLIESIAETQKVLHDYVRYYMRAPIWDISETELQRMDKLSYTDLCTELIILGLNPF